MRFTLFVAFVLPLTANVAPAQDRDRPSPQPSFGAAGGDLGLPGGGGGLAHPGQPGLGGGFGGMMGGGMGIPGLGFGEIHNRFQLFTGEVIPEGKDKTLPMILKIDTQTGQVWQLQVGAQNKVRFVIIEGQPGRINGPRRGLGGGGPVNPATGLPLNPQPQAPQGFPGRPVQPSPRLKSR